MTADHVGGRTIKTPSLRGRVILAGVIAGGIALLGLDAFVWLSLRDRLTDNLEDVLASRVQLVEQIDPTLGPVELDARLTELGIPAIVHATTGVDRESSPAATPPAGLPPARGGEPGATIDADVLRSDGTVVTVQVARAGVDGTLRRVLLLELFGSAAAIAVLAALLLGIARRALEPLDQMGRTARRITGGEFDERLRPDRPETELGQLATAFDEMLDALESALADARSAEARTRAFLARAAHQLRTPVAALRSSVDALIRVEDPEEADHLLDNLARETARASRLVRSLLRIAELDEQEEPRRQQVPLHDLLLHEAERASEFTATATVRVVGHAPDVHGDPDALQELVANLLDNAVRHARTTVEVRVEDLGGQLAVRVADDGPGVPKEQGDVVFERFVTLDDRGGSGLGLPIARAIARAHGGDVVVDAGSFVVLLPKSS